MNTEIIIQFISYNFFKAEQYLWVLIAEIIVLYIDYDLTSTP